MSWFEELTGIDESDLQQVEGQLKIEGDRMLSLANQRSFSFGRLETPSLAELRDRVQAITPHEGKLTVKEVVADVQDLHADPANKGALFQVASQFNLLEMVSPNVTPEGGVGIYQYDLTQGPACAIACGAGTIYRNYFAPVNGQTGQSASNQIDCLADLGAALGNANNRLWEMRNGYALATRDGLEMIRDLLAAASEEERDSLRQKLRIGLQWNTQVTIHGSKHLVSQAYCSALPASEGNLPPDLWEPFARLVLEASYEASFCAALLNANSTGNTQLFLTMLGGGAFGNTPAWITDAISRSLRMFQHAELEVGIVSFRYSNPDVVDLCR